MSIGFGIAVFVAALAIRQFQIRQVERNMELSLEKEAVNLKKEITEVFESHVKSLIRMAKRWDMRDGMPRKEWESDAGYYLNHHPGYRAIFWLRSYGKAEWAVPENSNITNRLFLFLDSPKRLFIRNVEGIGGDGEAFVSAPVPGGRSGDGFDDIDDNVFSDNVLVSVPLRKGQAGSLAAVINIQSMLDPILEDKGRLGYALSVHDGGREIYSSSREEPSPESGHMKRSVITMNEVQWKVRLWIEDASRFTGPGLTLGIILFLDFLIAGLLVSSLYFGMKAHVRAKKLEQSRADILEQMRKAEEAGEKEKIAQKKLLQSQEMLRQSQKMETAGRLAGGVAHDFNNILASIQLNAEFLLDACENNQEVKEDILQIEEAVQRARELTKQLLAFSKTQVLNLENLNMDLVVQDLLKMFKRVIGEDIELKIKAGSGGALVRVDKIQLEQIIMNLVLNSRDSMPRGGKLFLKTGTLAFQEGDLEAGVEPGNYVFLTVEDNGSGMDKETLSKIFEPFFTTKGSKGTGLGMSTVYGIAKQMGGFVRAYSEPGLGTSVKIYLPAVAAAEDPGFPSPTAGREEMIRGKGSVLLIEDEEGVRESVEKILKKFGYQVTGASSRKEAMQAWQSAEVDFSLIVSDVILPDGTGPEFVKAVKSSRPGLKVLFISGYTDRIGAEYGDILTDKNFLQKPFTVKQLSQKLKEIQENIVSPPA